MKQANIIMTVSARMGAVLVAITVPARYVREFIVVELCTTYPYPGQLERSETTLRFKFLNGCCMQ